MPRESAAARGVVGLVDGASVDEPDVPTGFASATCEKDARQDKKAIDGAINETFKVASRRHQNRRKVPEHRRLPNALPLSCEPAA